MTMHQIYRFEDLEAAVGETYRLDLYGRDPKALHIVDLLVY